MQTRIFWILCWAWLAAGPPGEAQTFQRYVIDPDYDIHFTTGLQLEGQRARLVVAKPLPMGAVDFVWVINFDAAGNVDEVWQYGGFSFSGYVRGSLIAAENGLRLTIRDNNSSYLLRLHSDGSIAWCRRFPELRGENRSMLAVAGDRALIYGDMIIGTLENTNRRAYFSGYDGDGQQLFSHIFFLRDRPELNLVTRDVIAHGPDFYLALVEGNVTQSGILVQLDDEGRVIRQRTYPNTEIMRLRRLPDGDLLAFGRSSTDGIAFIARIAPDLTPRWFRTVEVENDFLQHSFSYLVVDPTFGFWLVTRAEIGLMLLRFDGEGHLLPGGNVVRGAVPWGAEVDDQQQLYLALARQTPGRNYPALTRLDPMGRSDACDFFDPCFVTSQAYQPEHYVDPVAVGTQSHGESFSPSQGSYSLQLVDFCLEPYRLNTAFTLSDSEICVGETIAASATVPGPSSAWSFPGGSPGHWTGTEPPPVRLDSAGTITIQHRVTTLGCADSLSVSVEVLDGPALDLGPDQTLCRGDRWFIDPSLDAGAGFSWSDGFPDLPRYGVPGAEYVLLATDARGCRRVDTLRLALSSVYELELGGDTTRCAGETHRIQPAIPAEAETRQWQDGSTGPGLSVAESGTYRLSIADANGCRYADSLAVRFLPVPVVEPLGTAIRCAGRDTLFTAVVRGEFDRLRWSEGTEGASLWLREPGRYDLEVSLGGCTARDSLLVREAYCLPPRYYPSAFSPNGDGHNDRWQVFGEPDLEWLELEIFDRWGGMIWRSVGDPSWSGRDLADRPVPAGLYLARLRFRLPNTDRVISESTPIQVLR